jgi:WD40 repeat protein
LTGVFDLAFSPDETHLVATGMDGLHHWDLDRGQYTHIPMPCSTFAVAFDPKGDRFVTGSAQGELHWWRLGDPRPTRIVAAHAHRVTAVAFSPDGRVLATTGWDRRLRIWHVPTAQPFGPGWELPDDGQSVAFRPDGPLLSVGCKGGQIVRIELPSPAQGDRTSATNAIRLATGLEWDEHDTVRPLDERSWRELRSAGSRHVETP